MSDHFEAFHERVRATGADTGWLQQQIDAVLAASLPDQIEAVRLGGLIAEHLCRADLAVIEVVRRLENIPEAESAALRWSYWLGRVLGSSQAGGKH